MQLRRYSVSIYSIVIIEKNSMQHLYEHEYSIYKSLQALALSMVVKEIVAFSFHGWDSAITSIALSWMLLSAGEEEVYIHWGSNPKPVHFNGY